MQHKSDYILDHFKKVFGIDELPVSLSYGTGGQAKVIIRQGDTAPLERGEKYIPEDRQIVWKTWKGTRVPFFFGDDAGELISQSGDQYYISQDIIASAFYLLSGWQEHFCTEFDRYGRFPYGLSLQKKLGITGIPIVNYYFDILKTVMEQASGKPFTPVSWSGKPYALCLTHDIDSCESAWLQGSRHALKKGNLFTPFLLVAKKLLGRDGWFNFSEIVELETRYGANSTFFFLVTPLPAMGIKNADYRFSRRKFTLVQHLITGSGSEVAIHGSAGTSTDSSRLKAELTGFRLPVKGNRFHFLLYSPSFSGKTIEDTGLNYDASLGFAEETGFRNSFCFPFKPWDIQHDRPFRHTEIPLVLMDGTLQKYLGLQPAQAPLHTGPLFDEVRKFGGCMTVLWHNTHFSAYKYPGWKEVYIKTLEKGAMENAAMLSCSSLLDMYAARTKFHNPA
ncbi:MAG: polysaccharide deacetylase family protein [Bacteroidota bacterium]